ncbi:MAG: hypothetical protein Aurels2KO_35410 [Aureliella sp.]
MSKSKGRSKARKPNTRRANSEPAVGQHDVAQAWAMLRGVAIAVVWLLSVLALSTRTHQVMGYGTLRTLSPSLEPIAADFSVLAVALLVLAPWFWLRRNAYTAVERAGPGRWLVAADAMMAGASLPCLISVGEILIGQELPRLFWEPVLLAGATGGSYFSIFAARSLLFDDSTENEAPSNARRNSRWPACVVAFACVAVGGWWFAQADFYHSSFMLGFNDFGHFAQRIANTAGGNGVLLETPVLPMFWDHFNPGLLLLVPLWCIWPDEKLFFALQAFAMAASGGLVYRIARQLRFSPWIGVAFCCGWLVQPVVGQMNIAYTYGWHPITMAIPLMLLAISWALAGRYGLATCALVIAMTMEEGVIAVVAIWACVSALRLRLTRRLGDVTMESTLGMSEKAWWCLGIVCILAFIAVFKFSGLAEFQTGRFVALGDSLWEVVLSPVLRPQVFWGQLVRPESAYLLLCLFLPLGTVSLWRGRSMLVAFLPPLGVLLVWDHAPATSLAFQYASSLLPLFWFTALEGARQLEPRFYKPAAAASVVTGFVLSLFVGQLPFSRDSLVEVKAATYLPNNDMRRVSGAADTVWVLDQLDAVRSADVNVLATGRIAAHLVGCNDIETVGQFIERRPQLEKLADRSPGLRYYDWIVLDRIESFQQSREQSEAVYLEALADGFVVHAEKYDVVLLRRTGM